MRSNRARNTTALVGIDLVELEIGMEVPNQLAHSLLNGAVPIRAEALGRAVCDDGA
jgi:hypothetical protein